MYLILEEENTSFKWAFLSSETLGSSLISLIIFWAFCRASVGHWMLDCVVQYQDQLKIFQIHLQLETLHQHGQDLELFDMPLYIIPMIHSIAKR